MCIKRKPVVWLVTLALLLTLCAVPVGAFAQELSVNAEDGTDVFGVCQVCSTYARGELLPDSFYYTDGWFDREPTERNDALALLSMQLTAAAIDGTSDGCGAALLRHLGSQIQLQRHLHERPDRDLPLSGPA